MYHYSTLTSVLEDLQKRGFVYDFDIQGNCIECEEAFEVLQPGEFEVAEVYRFEEPTEPGMSAFVYAVSSVKGLKGIVINPKGLGPVQMLEQMAHNYDFCEN